MKSTIALLAVILFISGCNQDEKRVEVVERVVVNDYNQKSETDKNPDSTIEISVSTSDKSEINTQEIINRMINDRQTIAFLEVDQVNATNMSSEEKIEKIAHIIAQAEKDIKEINNLNEGTSESVVSKMMNSAEEIISNGYDSALKVTEKLIDSGSLKLKNGKYELDKFNSENGSNLYNTYSGFFDYLAQLENDMPEIIENLKEKASQKMEESKYVANALKEKGLEVCSATAKTCKDSLTPAYEKVQGMYEKAMEKLGELPADSYTGGNYWVNPPK